MVAQEVNRNIRGSGIIDNIISKFTAQRYLPERHAISLANDTFGKPMQFMGPFTRLDLRLDENEKPKPDSQPLRKSDYASYEHDLAYKHAGDDYFKNPTPENKKTQMRKIWSADDKFIRDMDEDPNEPMAAVAQKLIQMKESGEKLGILPTTKFSGFVSNEEGSVDPVARLRNIVKEQYVVDERKERKKKKKMPNMVAVQICQLLVKLQMNL